VRTKELRLSGGSESLMYLKEMRAHLAENLGPLLSVVVVEVDMWSSTAGADYMGRNR
jgi:hypothetical protein